MIVALRQQIESDKPLVPILPESDFERGGISLDKVDLVVREPDQVLVHGAACELQPQKGQHLFGPTPTKPCGAQGPDRLKRTETGTVAPPIERHRGRPAMCVPQRIDAREAGIGRARSLRDAAGDPM